MSERTISNVDLSATIDADDVVRGLGNNDENILTFVLQMLDHAGSSDLEEELLLRIKERLRFDTIEVPGSTAPNEVTS